MVPSILKEKTENTKSNKKNTHHTHNTNHLQHNFEITKNTSKSKQNNMKKQLSAAPPTNHISPKYLLPLLILVL